MIPYSAVALRQLAEVEQLIYTLSVYTVYAIYNQECDKIYVGQTGDMARRLQMHNDHALGGFTSRFSGQWVMIYKEEAETRSDALKREKQLKSFKGREFIRKHIPR